MIKIVMKHSILNSIVLGVLINGLISCQGRTLREIPESRLDSPVDVNLKGSISISGAFALYPLVNVWAGEFSKLYPDVRINISAGGAGKGMADVMSGAVDLGMFSRDFTPSEKEKGVWWVSVTKDAVLPTISDHNPLLERLKEEGITRKELRNIFLEDGKKNWKKSNVEINVYTRSDAAGAAVVWAQYLGGTGQEDLRGIAVYGDPGLADAVKNDPVGIGFNNVIYIYDLNTGRKYDGIEVVPIDINENGLVDPDESFYESLKEIDSAIANGRYPSPPTRELFLISNGTPVKTEVKAFLNWILEEGQEFVDENGYIRLSKKVIDTQKLKL